MAKVKISHREHAHNDVGSILLPGHYVVRKERQAVKKRVKLVINPERPRMNVVTRLQSDKIREVRRR